MKSQRHTATESFSPWIGTWEEGFFSFFFEQFSHTFFSIWIPHRILHSPNFFSNFSQFEYLKRKETSYWSNTVFFSRFASRKKNHNKYSLENFRSGIHCLLVCSYELVIFVLRLQKIKTLLHYIFLYENLKLKRNQFFYRTDIRKLFVIWNQNS